MQHRHSLAGLAWKIVQVVYSNPWESMSEILSGTRYLPLRPQLHQKSTHTPIWNNSMKVTTNRFRVEPRWMKFGGRGMKEHAFSTRSLAIDSSKKVNNVHKIIILKKKCRSWVFIYWNIYNLLVRKEKKGNKCKLGQNLQVIKVSNQNYSLCLQMILKFCYDYTDYTM